MPTPNIPNRVMCIQTQYTHWHLLAVDDNGVVSSPPLYFGHFLNHISDGLEVGAPSIGCPVGDMELSHLVSFLRLQKKNIN